MSREVTVRLRRVDEYLPPQVRRALLEKIAVLGVGRIKRRTKAGQDIEGQPFAPYSAPYADKRKRAGWQTTPDLWLRGHMLGSMAVLSADADRAVIGFQGSSAGVKWAARARSRKHKKTGERLDLTPQETGRRVANGLKAYWNQNGKKPRRFFGFSKADRVFLTRTALKDLLAYIGRASTARLLKR